MKTKNLIGKQETIWADFQMPNNEDPYLKDMNNLTYYSKHFNIITDYDSGQCRGTAVNCTISVYDNHNNQVLDLAVMRYASPEQALNKFLELKNKWIFDYDNRIKS